MQIGVSGFQSLERVKLEFDGFTVVTGESNLGKSALFRAVQSPVFGMAGDFFIRKGFKLCAVGVRFDPSLALKWQKVPADKKAPGRETMLDINGVQHTKIGKDHFSLTEHLGFLNIPTAAGSLRPQFAGQFDKAFLLDVSDTVVAEVFKVLGRGDVVAAARDSARRDLSKRKSELAVRDGDIGVAQEIVKKGAWIRPFAKSVMNLQNLLPALKNRNDLLGRVSSWCSEKVPELLPEVPDVPDYSQMLAIMERVESYKDLVVPEVPVVGSDLGVWKDLLERVESMLGESVKIDSLGVTIETDLKEALRDIAELEKELGVCPLCGGGFDHAHS